MLLRVLLWLIAVAPLHAATFTVTNGNDSGSGSLRQALQATQFNGQADTIVFAAGLNGATVFISGDTLVNNDGDGVTIDATALSAGITIRQTGARAVLYNDGSLTLRGLTVTGANNSDSFGGAVQTSGTMTLERCTLSGNSSQGGGAIYNAGGLTLRQCTLAGNTASFEGAAIYNQGLTILIHCTVVGNSPSSPKAGILNDTGATLVLENSIVAGNGGVGGTDVSNAGAVTLNGANIVQTTIAGLGTINGSGTASQVDPQLAPLGNYGGPTQTMPPSSTSPAIDAAVGSVETIDQRGRPRPIDGDLTGAAVADIGAVEFASSNADLASLALSVGTLSPTFDAATTGYTAMVSNATTGITVTPTHAPGGTTITVNGNAVASGSPSGNLALSLGQNPINVIVTAQDGSTKTYTVTVTRISNELASLGLSAGTLNPVFAGGTTSYTATVSFDVPGIKLTPTALAAGSTITVNGNAVASGSASGSIPLNVGLNTITTTVTAQDSSQKTYTVDVTRQANANLSSLSLSAGTLSPAFASATTTYTAIVTSTTSITVTPTVADANATVTVNGTPVNSGSASGIIPLNRGPNPITIVTTAQDGTMKTYTVTVIQAYLVSVTAASGAGSLRQAIIDAETSAGPDTIVFDPSLGGQTISATGGPLVVGSNDGLTIDGSALPGGATISGDNSSSIFSITGAATFISVTITNGGSPGSGASGAIAVTGTLRMIDCTLRNNSAADGFGGAIFPFNGANVTLEHCTLSQNSAKIGGAIFIGDNSNTTLRNCTLVENTASEESGAIGVAGNGATALLTHCTVVGSSAPDIAGVKLHGSSGVSATLDNCIIAGNGGGIDVLNLGTLTVTGANIIQSRIFGNAAVGGGSVSAVDPQLSAFGNYGGPTQTMPPMPGSPAIDAAVGSTLTIDQRGKPRPINGDLTGAAVADIGAVEFASSNADLASLALSVGTLTPDFDAAITSYTARVSPATASLTLTPTTAFVAATITVNGTPVVSGNATADLALNVGANVIATVVTAQDGTMKTYTVTAIRNTPPTAPNGTATATTGDQKTITLPYPATDADGDTVTLTDTTPDAHLTVNSTDGKDVTFTPPTNYVGDATLGYAVSDGNGGTASGTITITISDNDAPVINPHANVSVLTTGLGGVVVNYAAATASDNVTASPTITYSQDSGTTFPLGTTTVTVNAVDAAGNAATPVTFDVIVHLTAPVSTTLRATGGPAPDLGVEGVPADAVLASFGVPCVDESGNVSFLAKWTSQTEGKGSGLFHNANALVKIGGNAQPITGAKFKTIGDPVGSADHVAFLATLSVGSKTVAAVASNAAGGRTPQVIAQAGDPALDAAGAALADGAKFKSFKAVAVEGDYVAVFAQLTGPAASDLGLWIKDGSDPLKLALREGQTVATGKKIKTLVTFAPGNGSPGQGRGWLRHTTAASGAEVMALCLFEDKSQGIVVVDAGNLASPSLLTVSGVGGFPSATNPGPPFVAGLAAPTFASYGPPARNSAGEAVFRGALTPDKTIGTTVTKANASAIFTGPTTGGYYGSIARVGDDAGTTGAKFSLLKDPVLAEDGTLAFPATLKATPTVKGLATTTLWWRPAGKAFGLLAQAGTNTSAVATDLPTGAQWKAFTSLAVASGRGPIFTATLVPNKTNVTAATASGVWAMDYTGTLRTLFRTGDKIGGKTVSKFTLLNATVGSTGVTRSFNDNAQVVWLATFTDKTQAVVTTEVP